MALTVTNNMTTETNGDADALTGWTSSSTDSLYTAFFREASGCIGMGGSNSDEDDYITITSADFSARTIFGWMLNGSPGLTSAIGFGILVGDGTNDRIYGVGGSDNYGHFVNGWSGFRLDCAVLPASSRNITGAGAPTFTTITKIGYGMNYSIGAFGKVDNVFLDVLRWIANGSPALSISGGTTGARGTWAELKDDDESTADTKAYGICRLLTASSKAYELTYGIEFGAATGDTFFSDNNFQLIIAGISMSAGNMDVGLVAGTGNNLFIQEDGVIVGVGTVSNWDLSAAFETMQFNRMTVTDLGTIAFPDSGGTLREATDCIFNNCGQIQIGTNFTFTGHSFNGTTDPNGALEFNTATDETNATDLSFVSDGTGHAIEITAAGTYDITDYVFTGYSTANAGSNPTASTGSTDAVFFNDSGGTVTLNVSGGGGTITVRNGAGADTIVNNNVSVTFANLKDNSEVRIYNAGTNTELAGIEDATAGSPDARTFAASIAASTSVDYVIHNFQPGATIYQTIRVNAFTWPTAITTITIQQQIDRNAEN